MLTRDLKKSTDNLVVHGKLIVNVSTNLSQPPRGQPPPAIPGRPSVASAQSSTLSAAGPSERPHVSHVRPGLERRRRSQRSAEHAAPAAEHDGPGR